MSNRTDDQVPSTHPPSLTTDAPTISKASCERSNDRLNWADCARGIGIILVVLGHVNAGLIGAHMTGEYGPALSAANKFIYTFHMALFFVAAGLFAPRSVRKAPREYWSDKLGGLLYPYLIWSVIQLGFQRAFSGQTNTAPNASGFAAILYEPTMQFWFLYCLLIAQVLYRVLTRLGGTQLQFLILTVSLSLLLAGFELSATSVLGRCRDNLPLFAIGVVLSRQLAHVAKVPNYALGAVVTGGIAFSAVVSRAVSGHPGVVAAVLFPLPGTAAVFALSMLIANRKSTSALATLGKYSLEIYLAHVIAYAGTRIMLKQLGVTSIPAHIIAGTVMGIAGPLLLVKFTQMVGATFVFRCPSLQHRNTLENRSK
ncbi:MAG: hypothetical protein C0483_17540 [Pirellula sp.]|nr:hypothetical protein [Pirellula sp.]